MFPILLDYCVVYSTCVAHPPHPATGLTIPLHMILTLIAKFAISTLNVFVFSDERVLSFHKISRKTCRKGQAYLGLDLKQKCKSEI